MIFNKHPYQHIQEEWMSWLTEGPFTHERYLEFMRWREDYLKLNPID